MSLHHFPQIVPDSIQFYFDSRKTANYVGTNVTSVVGTKTLVANSVTRSGVTTTLTNSNNSNVATSDISDSSYDSIFLNKANITASVTFKQTSLLNISNPAHWRMTPFSFGIDGDKGMWGFEIFSNNFLIRYNFNSSGTYGNELSITSDSLLNKWTNATFVNDGSKIKAYLNGVKVSEVSIADMTVTSSNISRLSIGSQNRNGTKLYGFVGNVDTAIFYSRVLTDDEILKNAKNFLARCV